jgi:subtilisin family serine protease
VRYLDKSTNRMVELADSRTAFLAIADPTQAESLNSLVSQRAFNVVGSTNDDGVFVLEARSQGESLVELDKIVETIRSQPGVRAVVPALVDEQGHTRYYLPDQVIVQFSDPDAEAAKTFLSSLGARVERKLGLPGVYRVRIPDSSDIGSFIATLNQADRVAFAEPAYYGVNDADLRVTISRTASAGSATSDVVAGGDGEYESLGGRLSWNLEKLDLLEAWHLTDGSGDVVVAVVDGMPEHAHEALIGKLATTISNRQIFAADDSVSSHATNICGIIAGESDRFSGVAPGVRLVPLVVNLNSQLYAERAAAIRFAADCARAGRIGRSRINRLVLSCSWRTAGDVAVIRTALEDAIRAGVLIVCSAGNTNSNEAHYPSAYSNGSGVLAEGVLCVAATDQEDRKASYSNYSSTVDLCAPGGDGLPIDERDVPCPEQGNQYGFAAGTSIAVPHVAAVAAMMLSLDPDLSPATLKRQIAANADSVDAQNPGYQHLLGTGRLNARRALSAVANDRTVTSPDDPSPAPETTPTPSRGSGPRVTIRVRTGPRVAISTN